MTRFRLALLFLLLYHSFPSSRAMEGLAGGSGESGFRLVVRQVSLPAGAASPSTTAPSASAAGPAPTSALPISAASPSLPARPDGASATRTAASSAAPVPPSATVSTLAAAPSSPPSSQQAPSSPQATSSSAVSAAEDEAPTSMSVTSESSAAAVAPSSSVPEFSTTAVVVDQQSDARNEAQSTTTNSPSLSLQSPSTTSRTTAAQRGRPNTSVRRSTTTNLLDSASPSSALASPASPSVSPTSTAAPPLASATASFPSAPPSSSTSHKKHISIPAALGSILAIIVTSLFGLLAWRLYAAKRAREQAQRDEEEIERIKRELAELGGGVRASFQSVQTSSEEGHVAGPFSSHSHNSTLLFSHPLPPASLPLPSSTSPAPLPPILTPLNTTDLDRAFSTRTNETAATTGSAFDRFSGDTGAVVFRVEERHESTMDEGGEQEGGRDGENLFADPRV